MKPSYQLGTKTSLICIRRRNRRMKNRLMGRMFSIRPWYPEKDGWILIFDLLRKSRIMDTPQPPRSVIDKFDLVSGIPRKLNPPTNKMTSAGPTAIAMPKYSKGRNGFVLSKNAAMKIKPNPPKAMVRLTITARRISGSGSRLTDKITNDV